MVASTSTLEIHVYKYDLPKKSTKATYMFFNPEGYGIIEKPRMIWECGILRPI